MTAAVVGVSSILFFLGCLILALASSTPMPLTKAFSSAGEFCLILYFPFFWLPFALGALLGGIVSRFARPPALVD